MATSDTSTTPRTPSARAHVQRLAERAVLIPIGAALEARERVTGTAGELVAQARRTLGANVEALSDRVGNVVQNGVNTGIKLVNGAQDRFTRAA